MEQGLLDDHLVDNEQERDFDHVGFWPRVGAALIDVLIYLPIIGLMVLNMTFWGNLGIHILFLIVLMVYKPFMEARFGATVGKMAIGAKVVSTNYEPISANTAISRYFPFAISQLISIFSAIVVAADYGFSTTLSFVQFSAVQAEVVPSAIDTAASIFGLVSVLAVAFSSSKQGLHDQMAKTYVVRK